MFCIVAPRKLGSVWNLLELLSYGKFDFSRPKLDRNTPAKGNA